MRMERLPAWRWCPRILAIVLVLVLVIAAKIGYTVAVPSGRLSNGLRQPLCSLRSRMPTLVSSGRCRLRLCPLGRRMLLHMPSERWGFVSLNRLHLGLLMPTLTVMAERRRCRIHHRRAHRLRRHIAPLYLRSVRGLVDRRHVSDDGLSLRSLAGATTLWVVRRLYRGRPASAGVVRHHAGHGRDTLHKVRLDDRVATALVIQTVRTMGRRAFVSIPAVGLGGTRRRLLCFAVRTVLRSRYVRIYAPATSAAAEAAARLGLLFRHALFNVGMVATEVVDSVAHCVCG